MKRTYRMMGLCGLAALALLVSPTPAAGAVELAAAPPITWVGGAVLGVQGVAVSPDRQLVATAAQDNTVKLWQASTGVLLRTLTSHDGHVSSVAFTPDGRFVASGGEFVFGDPSGNVKLWRVADGAFLGDFPVPQSGQVFSVAVSPDGTLLAGGLSNGAQGGQINLWRIADRTLVRRLSGHTDSVFSVAFSPNGQLLASGGADNTVRVWRVSSGTRLRTLTGHTFFVSSVAFSPDGTMLASGSWDMTIRLWRVSNFGLIRTLRGHTDAVYTIAFSPDGTTLASGSNDNTVRLWRPSTGAPVRTIDAPFVSSIAFAGSATLVGGSFDSHVRVWRVSDGALLTTMGKHTGPVKAVAYSPDGTLVGSAADDLTVRLWRATDGADVQTLAEHDTPITAIAFSPDSKLVASASEAPAPFQPGVIKIWRVDSPNSILTIRGHIDGTTGVAFSADGTRVISTGNDRVLRMWNVADGALVFATNKGNPNGTLAVDTKRTSIATESTASGILLFNPDGSARLNIPVPNSVSSLSFSGDGTQLGVGEEAFGNNVQVFRAADGALVRSLPGDPDGFVQGVAFAPTGSVLLSGSGFTHLIQVWDTATGSLLTTYDRETGWGQFPQLPLAFAPSGAAFAYGRGDGPVVVAKRAF